MCVGDSIKKNDVLFKCYFIFNSVTFCYEDLKDKLRYSQALDWIGLEVTEMWNNYVYKEVKEDEVVIKQIIKNQTGYFTLKKAYYKMELQKKRIQGICMSLTEVIDTYVLCLDKLINSIKLHF
ncbi:hypothetical protein [Alkalitalea saponilacus]|uniref:Uncharacterized protein n=1 Tax=Alkalitalea saponilacus TaxID=889453 RepID=A0A1T5BI04_9BACT|nr:hypothetical protein [Alkalitalea saponilacus]ASB49687.1 hypothetical protein CDL62_11330 [Alkalitalea saponilacus]SKB46639.1 hypothetical protein SAMN03080601_00518 [Alkalitalea saponilacus]